MTRTLRRFRYVLAQALIFTGLLHTFALAQGVACQRVEGVAARAHPAAAFLSLSSVIKLEARSSSAPASVGGENPSPPESSPVAELSAAGCNAPALLVESEGHHQLANHADPVRGSSQPTPHLLPDSLFRPPRQN